jgi:hypothetical protein
LKDISGNGLSEGLAFAIGKAEMSANKYIKGGICCSNMSRDIQKSLINQTKKNQVINLMYPE